MKFSSQEEFGMRLLLRIAKSDSPHGLTIPEISVLEGISISNAGKILRILRLGGFVDSARGQTGGYKLTKPPNEIIVNDVMIILGGKLYESDFCDLHAGTENICTNSIDCSIRSLWKTIQRMIDDVLIQISLQDLLGKEEDVDLLVSSYVERIKNLCV